MNFNGNWTQTSDYCINEMKLLKISNQVPCFEMREKVKVWKLTYCMCQVCQVSNKGQEQELWMHCESSQNLPLLPLSHFFSPLPLTFPPFGNSSSSSSASSQRSIIAASWSLAPPETTGQWMFCLSRPCNSHIVTPFIQHHHMVMILI